MGIIVYAHYHNPHYLTNTIEYAGNCIKIKLTCGGGMGGSSWKTFTKNDISIDMLNNNQFIEIEEPNGDLYIINTNYIVDIERVSITFDEEWIDKNWNDYSTIYNG